MIDPQHIQADLEAIAACTATPGPGEGATRPTFSPAWGKAREYVRNQAEAAGCVTRTDAAGNLHARPMALGWDAPAWLVGSHIDTVPHGGDYDGVVGVVLALELLRSAKDEGVTDLPVELIEFAEEEGPTFGLGMLGSRIFVADLAEKDLRTLTNSDGQNYLRAGESFGVDAARFAGDRLDPSRYLGFIELHIEQGPGMWRRDQRLAIVTAIAGRRQYTITVQGAANHAGATAMPDRRDALTAAAEIILALEKLAPRLSPETVITVGKLHVYPNAVNVIAERVDFTIDFRAPADATLGHGDRQLRVLINDLASARGCRVKLDQTEAIPARPMDPRLIEQLSAAAGAVPHTVSGALHDAAVLAPHVPTVMLFIPSRDGISHSPAEFSRVEDVAHAAEVVERVVRRPTLNQLNAMNRDAFIATVGGVFERSPWIAVRAWERRPFADLDALLVAMRSVIDEATDDERLALIRVHPDLVGRLAQEGGLTAESTAEQRAAGLDTVTPDEAERFARYNAAYREKFGFPFVICAREHRKDTILREMPHRLDNDTATEQRTALEEITKIARLRLYQVLWAD